MTFLLLLLACDGMPANDEITLADPPMNEEARPSTPPPPAAQPIDLPPKPQVDGPAIETRGQVLLEPGSVRETVQKYFGQLTYCYEGRLHEAPDLEGRVEVEWNVKDRRVTSVNVARNTTGDDELAACIVSKIQRWRFPDGVEGEILYPFLFKRRD